MKRGHGSQPDRGELLARARRLQVKARHVALAQFAGLYRSAFKGQGVEFSDVREYAPGDDIRLIDWNVSARSQTLFVKRMAEERERSVLLAMDTSASLAFGTVRRTKFELLQELSALLALACSYGSDRVSLALFRSTVEAFVPAAKGWTHTERIVREIASARPGGTSGDLEPFWAFVNSAAVPRSLLFFLADFQAPLRAGNGLLAACRKHEIIALLVSDPREWALPPVGRVRVSDPESGRTRVINTDRPETRVDYERCASEARVAVTGTLRRAGIEFVHLTTGADYEAALRRFLEARIAKTEYRRP